MVRGDTTPVGGTGPGTGSGSAFNRVREPKGRARRALTGADPRAPPPQRLREIAMSGTTALPTPSGPNLDKGLLPADFYAYEEMLSDREREKVASVREFLRTQVAPIVDDYWARAEFPFQLVEGFGKLGMMDWADPDSPESRPSNLLAGFIALELAHVDASLATFGGVHTGLAMGTILTCGSDEQKRRWLPMMSRFEKIGAFGLTEPHGGSDVAGGLRTTARRDGDVWILDGAKRWIGNATFADLVVIWARDVETQHVLGFVVEKDTPDSPRRRSRTRWRCGSCRTPTSCSTVAAYRRPTGCRTRTRSRTPPRSCARRAAAWRGRPWE